VAWRTASQDVDMRAWAAGSTEAALRMGAAAFMAAAAVASMAVVAAVVMAAAVAVAAEGIGNG
jgi:hypothetical protein